MSRFDRDQVSTPPVTARELEVPKLVAQDLNNRQIGTRLFSSENTVKNHVRNILDRSAAPPLDAVMYAVRERLFDVPDR